MSTDVVEIQGPPAVVTQVEAFAWQKLEVSTTSGELVVVDAPAVQLVQVITPGPMGPQGDVGERGEPGPSPSFELRFPDATEVWVIHHPLHAYPVTTTVDLNGAEIIGDVQTPDLDTVVVTFYMPVAGTARLKA